MLKVPCILGDIPAETLGFCQCHEHLMISKGVSYELVPALCMEDISKTQAELLQYKRSGGNAIIDAQPVGCNRMEIALAQLSHDADIHIIASTGFHKLCFYPKSHWIFTATEKELESLYIHELTIGMFSQCDTQFPDTYSNYKAGIIKTALDVVGLTPSYKKLFCAAMTASLQTHTPIMVHIEKGSDPLALLDYMITYGMDPHSLIFCHMDRACADISIHKKVLSKGVFLEFDTIGRFKYHNNLKEVEIIKTLLAAGYGNQLLLSLDTTRERLKAYTDNAVGLDYILTTFIPLMKKEGITTEQIHKFFHENCIQVLSTYT